MAAELEGDQGQIDQRMGVDGAAAVRFAGEQARPPELGAAMPVVVGEPVGIATQITERVGLGMPVEKARRRLAEEHLIGRWIEQHAAS